MNSNILLFYKRFIIFIYMIVFCSSSLDISQARSTV